MNYDMLCNKVISLFVYIFLLAFFSQLLITCTGLYYEFNTILTCCMLISFISVISSDKIAKIMLQLYRKI